MTDPDPPIANRIAGPEDFRADTLGTSRTTN